MKLEKKKYEIRTLVDCPKHYGHRTNSLLKEIPSILQIHVNDTLQKKKTISDFQLIIKDRTDSLIFQKGLNSFIRLGLCHYRRFLPNHAFKTKQRI